MRSISRTLFKFALVSILVAGLGLSVSALAEDPMPSDDGDSLSLITSTPGDGFALAVELTRRTVKTIQHDKGVLQAQRPAYAGDAEDMITVSQVVAIHFQTIAIANDYWRGR